MSSSLPSASDPRRASVDAQRPRLAPADDHTGVVPRFRAPPSPPTPALTEREALAARIHATRRESLTAFHSDPERRPQLMLVGRNELAQINADLEAVRALNATLPHQLKSRELADWPRPVFRPSVLHSWRDLFHALDLSARVLSAAAAHEQTWFYAHG